MKDKCVEGKGYCLNTLSTQRLIFNLLFDWLQDTFLAFSLASVQGELPEDMIL